MLDQPPGGDLGHELVGVVDALAPLEPQREREALREVLGRREGQLFPVVAHRRALPMIDCDENKWGTYGRFVKPCATGPRRLA